MPFVPEKMRGMTPIADLVDAKTGRSGRARPARRSPRARRRELAEERPQGGAVSRRRPRRPLPRRGHRRLETGEIYGEAGDELDAKLLES